MTRIILIEVYYKRLLNTPKVSNLLPVALDEFEARVPIHGNSLVLVVFPFGVSERKLNLKQTLLVELSS